MYCIDDCYSTQYNYIIGIFHTGNYIICNIYEIIVTYTQWSAVAMFLGLGVRVNI